MFIVRWMFIVTNKLRIDRAEQQCALGRQVCIDSLPNRSECLGDVVPTFCIDAVKKKANYNGLLELDIGKQKQ